MNTKAKPRKAKNKKPITKKTELLTDDNRPIYLDDNKQAYVAEDGMYFTLGY